jgi:hypothetical protein
VLAVDWFAIDLITGDALTIDALMADVLARYRRTMLIYRAIELLQR